MMKKTIAAAIAVMFTAGTAQFTASTARAEVDEARFAEGFGLSYLPITVIAAEQLIKKRGEELGVGPIKATMRKLNGGPAMIDALLSGQVDFISGGVPPMINLWDKTRGKQNVKAIAAMGNTPLHLNTIDPTVKTLGDLVGKGKIALPAVKISIQALTLQMAAEKFLGPDKAEILDKQTISMPHPEALQALLGGHTEITSHFASMPFLWQEQKDPKVHRVMSSEDVLGGHHSGSVLYNTGTWKEANPRVFKAVALAIEDAMALINSNPRRAAEIYLKTSGDKTPIEDIEALIKNPDYFEFNSTPTGIMPYVQFMHKRGQIKTLPDSWKDLFWENMHERKGN